MSVPNRIGIKRNHVFNETYQKHLSDLEEKSKQTAYDLSILFAELNKSNESKEETTKLESEGTTKENEKKEGDEPSCDLTKADQNEKVNKDEKTDETEASS